MRALLCVLAIAAAHLVAASEPIHVDGVVVYGKVRAVSLSDIREVIVEFTHSLNSARKPRVLEVVNSNEIRAYLPERGLGWTPMRRVHPPKEIAKLFPPDAGNHWYDASRRIDDVPAIFRLIRTADRAYIFPLTLRSMPARGGLTLVIPRRDQSAPRLLSGDARRTLTDLLAYKNNWFDGLDNTISLDHVAKNVGFEFRRGSDDLVLFFTFGTTVEATLNGEHIAGFLDDRAAQELKEWKKRYALPELTFHKEPNQAMQRTASKASIYLMGVCHPPFLCQRSHGGLAVADLKSR